MTDRTIEHRIKICEECECEMTPNLYPGNEFTEPDEGLSYIASVVPAWTCPNCGFHSLVLKEEMSDWLFANIRWHRSIVTGQNIAGELAEVHGMGEHSCSGCGACGAQTPDGPSPGQTLAAIFDEPEEEDTEEIPEKDGRIIH